MKTGNYVLLFFKNNVLSFIILVILCYLLLSLKFIILVLSFIIHHYPLLSLKFVHKGNWDQLFAMIFLLYPARNYIIIILYYLYALSFIIILILPFYSNDILHFRNMIHQSCTKINFSPTDIVKLCSR